MEFKSDMNVKRTFSGREQNLLIFLSWLMYTAAYLGRYSYTSNVNPIMTDFGIDHASAGLVTTFFFFAYGAGQVINGIFCRRYNKKYVLSAAMLISAALNLAFFIGVGFSAVKYMWFVNGCVQSVLWTSLIFTLSEKLDSAHLKTAMLAMSTPVAIGTFLSYVGSAFFVHIGNYRFSFLLGGIVMLIAGVFWFCAHVKIFDRVSGAREAEIDHTTEQEEKKRGHADSGIIVMIAVLAFFAVVNNLVKDGLNVWVPSILKESYGLGDSLSILLTLLLPMLGVFGSTLNVFLNKKIKNYVVICGLSFGAASVFMLFVILLIKTPYWLPILLCFGVVVFAMYAVNNVVTNMAPLYMRDKVNSGAMAGVLDGFCYLGSTISSYGLGVIADFYGWHPVFYLLFAAMLVCVAITVVYRAITYKKEKKRVC